MEDEILSLDYRLPAKKDPVDSFISFVTNMDGWEKTFNKDKPIPSWCECGTKISGYKTKGYIGGAFGIIDNVFRDARRVSVKWNNGTTVGYDIDYLNKRIEDDVIEILYERR